VLPGVTTNIKCSHPEVKVTTRPGVPKERKVHHLLGEGPSDVFSVHNSNIANLTAGVVQRVFTVDYGEGQQEPLPQTDLGFERATRHATTFLQRNSFKLSKWSDERFIDHYSDARQKKRYTAAAESLLVSPVCEKDSSGKPFIKAEKTNMSAKRDPAPRVITPCDPRYNISVGKFIKPVEGVLYGLLNKMCGGTTVMKGLNTLEVGEAVHEAWTGFSKPVGVGLDAKRFDQHTQGPALRFEQKIYRLFFSGVVLKEFARLMSWQLERKCKGYTEDGCIEYLMHIRASGDMNTGLGTCLIACCLIHSYMVDAGIKYRLLNNGDDCVIIVEEEDLSRLDGLFAHCKEAGYWMVIEEPVYEIEEIVFCQTHPVLTSAGWTMVREFPVSIGKDFVSLLPLTSESAWAKWAHDVGNCGIAINAGVPVLEELYGALARSGNGTFGQHPWTRNSGFFRMAVGLYGRTAPITEESRVSFWKAFGVTPRDQILMEEYYRDYTFNFVLPRRGKSNTNTYRISNVNNKPPGHHLEKHILSLHH